LTIAIPFNRAIDRLEEAAIRVRVEIEDTCLCPKAAVEREDDEQKNSKRKECDLGNRKRCIHACPAALDLSEAWKPYR
jgi:ferredoxin-like protein FixX